MGDSAKAEAAERYRLRIDCTPDGRAVVEDLRRRTRSKNNSELFRKALNVLEWAVEVKEKNYNICIERDGKTETVHLWY